MHDAAGCPVCQGELELDADGMIQGTVIKATPPKEGWVDIAVGYMIKSGWPKLAPTKKTE